jgi:hypothetical protein
MLNRKQRSGYWNTMHMPDETLHNINRPGATRCDAGA